MMVLWGLGLSMLYLALMHSLTKTTSTIYLPILLLLCHHSYKLCFAHISFELYCHVMSLFPLQRELSIGINYLASYALIDTKYHGLYTCP